MPAVSLTGQDTVIIDGITFASMADGNAFEVSFPNDLGTAKTGKNGNSIFAKNESGRMADVSLRVLLGSSDDKYLRSKLELWRTGDTALFPLMTGSLIKRVGDGNGNITSMIYQMSGGYFKKNVGAKTSAEGDTDQSVAVYQMQFTQCAVNPQ